MSRRLLILLLSLTAPLFVLPFSAASGGLRVDETATKFMLREGQVALAVENSAGREVVAHVRLELLDTEDQVVATASHDETIMRGASSLVVPLSLLPPSSSDDAVGGQILWYRLRYHISPSSPEDRAINSVESIIALSEITPDIFELRVSAPKYVREGLRSRLHVRAVHPLTLHPVEGVSVVGQINFYGEHRGAPLKATGTTNSEGYTSLNFDLPSKVEEDSNEIKITGRLGSLVQEANDHLQFDHTAKILINTDKPLYQPGQVMHVRALVFNSSKRALANADATVKIADEESTTVFSATLKTSRFGIASADWAIPTGARLGNYSINVETSGGQQDYSATQNVQISRYDLPNFAVSVHPDREYYLPGQNADVEVRGDYLFGQPVTRGHVRVVRETERQWNYREQKWETQEGERFEGDIDKEGRFVAHIGLEKAQAELATESGDRYRDLNYAAYLTDPTTNRTEQRRFSLRLTKEAIHIYATEANYKQAEGLPLEFYLSTFYPDGTPAQCEVAVSENISTSQSHHAPAPGERKGDRLELLGVVRTNRYGVAKVRGPVAVKRAQTNTEVALVFAARDRKGRSGHYDQNLALTNDAGIRVETDKTFYRAGEPVKALITANKPDLTVIVDVLRDMKVIRSEIMRLNHGRAFVTLPYSSEFKNELTITAFTNEARQIYYNYTVGQRTVLYPRDQELKLDVQLGQTTYRPGEEATADLEVRTADGRAVEGALGIVIFDKAVEERARTNQEFNSAYGFYNNFRSFVYGDDELAGVTHRDLERLNLHHAIPDGFELVADLLLQRAASNNYYYYAPNVFGESDHQGEQQRVFFPLISDRMVTVNAALYAHYVKTAQHPVDDEMLRRALAASNISFDALRDLWGVPYRAFFSVDRTSDITEIRSAGPDKRFGTPDDISASRMAWPYFIEEGRRMSSAVQSYHERTGDFIRDAVTLKSVLRREGFDFDALRDRWGKPYEISFDVRGTLLSINVRSGGPNGRFETNSYASDDFNLWTTWYNYFTRTQTRIDTALAAHYRATSSFPVNEAELRKALHGSGIDLDALRDWWGRPYYVQYKTEVWAMNRLPIRSLPLYGEGNERRTQGVRPDTRQVRSLTLFSPGPDGKSGTYDDFTAATFLSPNYEQEAVRDQNQRRTLASTSRQGAFGAIKGRVMDPAGAVVPGAKVIITGEVGEPYEVTTNDDGIFEVMNLAPGFYTVRIEQSGFKAAMISGVEVLVGRENTLTANLEIGAVSETVNVTDVAQIDQSSSAVSANLNDQIYRNTPGQRNVSSLFSLRPGIAGGPALDNLYLADGVDTSEAASGQGSFSRGARAQIATPRLREYFPETLVWRPSLETDNTGRAQLHFKLADNITTWKVSVIGSTLDGEVGATETEFRAFQPFFVEHDPPRVLTEGDEIQLPAVLRNYTEKAQTVDLEIKPEDWFTLIGPAQKQKEIAARDSAREIFSFRATAAVDEGRQRITATGPEASDAVEKPVRVHPDGQELTLTDSEVFTDAATLEANIPDAAIRSAMRAELKIYSNLMAHVVEGIEGILQRPYGCGEQTISSTYPNLLVLRAYKRNGGVPSTRTAAMARRYLQEGYERLLNYRVESGGFTYWGQGEADPALTAYALRFLTDAREFLSVDEKVIKGARDWLGGQQHADGGWSTYRGQTRDGVLSDAVLTSFIARVLAVADAGSAPAQSSATLQVASSTDPLARAFDYLSRRVEKINEPYLIASYALAAIDAGRKMEAARAVSRLRALAHDEGGMSYWELETNTPFYGWGLGGRIETTALAVRALARSREMERTAVNEGERATIAVRGSDDLVARGLLFLLHNKDRYGVWHSTQATINVLDAIITTVGDASAKTSARDTAQVIVNGQQVAALLIPPANQVDGPLSVDLSKFISPGSNRIEIRRAPGSSQATAQLVSTYWLPWSVAQAAAGSSLGKGARDGMRLAVAFDKSEARVGDEITCKVVAERTVGNHYGMMLAEVGLPPGADVDRASLERAMKEAGWGINRYDILPDRLIVYLWPLTGGTRFEFKFRPRYGLVAQTAVSVLYDYYNPEARTVVAPTRFVVH